MTTKMIMKCPQCEGLKIAPGSAPDVGAELCNLCEGAGEVCALCYNFGTVWFDDSLPCEDCASEDGGVEAGDV